MFFRSGPSPIVAAAACVLLAAAFACGDDAPDQPRPKAAKPTPTAVHGLEALPGDSWGVIGVDVGRLRRSQLVHRAVEQMLLRDPELDRRIDRLLEACELDPAEDLERILIGIGAEPDQVVMVVEGELDELTVARCVGEAVSPGGRTLSSDSSGGRTLYHVGGDPDRPDVWFAFGGESNLVVTQGRARLETALGEGPKLPANETLAALLEQVERDAGLWGVARVRPRIGQGLVTIAGGAVEEPPRAIFGSLRAVDGLDARLGVVTASDESAKELRSIAKSQVLWGSLLAQREALGPVVNRIEVAGEGDTVELRLQLDAEELREVLARIDSRTPSPQNPPVRKSGKNPEP